MNLGTIKTAVMRIAGVDATDPLVDWINAAMHEFEEAYPWPFLEEIVILSTDVPGSSVLVGTPADVLKIQTLRVYTANGAVVTRPNLKYLPLTQFQDEGMYPTDPTKQDEPTHYTLLGNDQILVWPPVNGDYDVVMIYSKFLPDLVADVDVPDIPARYHYTIVRGAAIAALEAESEEERAVTARTIFEDAIDRHITRLGGNKQEGQFNTVRDTQGYGSSC